MQYIDVDGSEPGVIVPAWPSRRQPELAQHAKQPDLINELALGDPGSDTAALEFGVDHRGRPVTSTVRVGYACSCDVGQC